MCCSLPTVRIGRVEVGGDRVGVSTIAVSSGGRPSSSWTVPTATVSQNSAAIFASRMRPKPYPLPFTTGMRPSTFAATCAIWLRHNAVRTVSLTVTPLNVVGGAR